MSLNMILCLCLTVTIEIVNDVAANEVKFHFSSPDVSRQCVYSDVFAYGDFVYGILPDTNDGDSDNFYIHNISVSSFVSFLCYILNSMSF